MAKPHGTLLLALLAWVLPARAEPPPAILYAYPDQSVWTVAVDAHGQPANPLLKVAGALFQRAGLPWSAAPYPAARMFENLRNGSANFSMLVKGPAVEQCCLISRRPIASTELRVFHPPGTPPVQAVADLRGKSVILIRGYSYGGLLPQLQDAKNGVVVYTAVSHQAAFTMLGHGRADYLLDYSGPAREIMAAQPGFAFQHETLDHLNVHLVLWRGYPDAEATMARLEAVAEELDADALMGQP